MVGTEQLINSIADDLMEADGVEAFFENVYEVIDYGDELAITMNDRTTKVKVSESKLSDELVERGATTEEADEIIEYCKTGCFEGKTLVLTSDGLKRIDEIKEGDLVFAKDVKTGATGYKPVKTVYRKSSEQFIRLNIQGEEIRTTPGHLFFANGWWKTAGHLEMGDKVMTSSGELKEVTSIVVEILSEPERIYNLNVEDYHTYFVSSQNLLVHNLCKPKTGTYFRTCKGSGLKYKVTTGNKGELIEISAKMK